jgi:iron(III) transport system ATP-binding protein
MSTTIRLEKLTKRFASIAPAGGESSHTTAVDAVDLVINAGELFFLLGPSGCGKTTLLRMIAGFIEPTSGRVVFEKVDAASGKVEWTRDMTDVPPNKRNTGMVFQSYALWPHMTVAQNVAFGLNVRKVAAAERDRRVAEALDAVQMGPYAQRKPNQLSGGQQQRVALARALVIRPDVLLLDEPLSNLDAKLRIELRTEIRRICKASGITGVYVTHEALSMADRVAIVSRGRVVQVGGPAELYRRPASRFVAEFLGETNFIAGQIADRRGDRLTVRTDAGTVESACLAPALTDAAPGAPVTLSIRPEAFRLVGVGTPGAIHAVVESTTYLGETAQLVARIGDRVRIKVSQLNPDHAAREGEPLALSVDPADVVALPPE